MAHAEWIGSVRSLANRAGEAVASVLSGEKGQRERKWPRGLAGKHLRAGWVGSRGSRHGIGIGGGKVIHLVARGNGKGPKVVMCETLDAFSSGLPIEVVVHRAPAFADARVASRAKSLLGMDESELPTADAEGFAKWCVDGEWASTGKKRLFPAIGRAASRIFSSWKTGSGSLQATGTER